MSNNNGFPRKVTIVEVSPRDGLQNEHEIVPTAIKVEFINRLAETGLKVIEATSFVSPKWIPQMADHERVMQQIKRKNGVKYPVLIPNCQGMEKALAFKPDEIAVFTAASETFSQKNTNCSIAESLNRIKEVINLAKANEIPVRGYISCVLGCPYEGEVSPFKVAELAEKLLELGCYQISLGDTIGVGTPLKTKKLIDIVAKKVPIENLAVHFHDTYGQALTNIYVSLEKGIATIDSSVGGLGGCPYAPGAAGNVATEDVLYMLHGMGIETRVDLQKLMAAGAFILSHLKHPSRSRVGYPLSPVLWGEG